MIGIWRSLKLLFHRSGPRWIEVTVTKFENLKAQRSPPPLLNPPTHHHLSTFSNSSPKGPLLPKVPSQFLLNTNYYKPQISQHPQEDMKMLKTIKKLKFWHRKKKKKKHYLPPPPPPPPPLPPPPCCCCCSFPSAPPLPPWYDTEQAYEAASGFAYSTQQQEEIVSEAALPIPSYPLNSTSSSYQQYMVPNPVYGIPAVPVPVPAAPTKEKSAGLFGCAFEIGRYLFRCFFPCFRVPEVR